MKIKFEELVPNDYNPRKLFRSASMEELKKSIEKHDLIEPLVVRKKGNKYEVVCGMRRYHALKDLKVDEVECYVRELTDIEAIDLSFIENLQRDDLTPIEEANMYLSRLKMMPEYQKFVEKKSKKNIPLGMFFIPAHESEIYELIKMKYSKSVKTIYRRLLLLTLPEDPIQNAIEIEDLPLQFAEELSRLRQIKDENIAQQYMLQMFEDYNKEVDKEGKRTMSIAEMNRRITGKVKFEKEKETNVEKANDERIKELEELIEETNDAYDNEAEKLVKLAITVSEKEGLDINEDFQIEDVEDVEIKKTDNLLTFLEEDNENSKKVK